MKSYCITKILSFWLCFFRGDCGFLLFYNLLTEAPIFTLHPLIIHQSLSSAIIRAPMNSKTFLLDFRLSVTGFVTTLTSFVSPQPSLFFFSVLCLDLQICHLALYNKCSVTGTSLLLFWSIPPFRIYQHSISSHTLNHSVTLLFLDVYLSFGYSSLIYAASFFPWGELA